MHPILAVLFDLDNTLFDRDEAFVLWARAFLRDSVGLVAGEEFDKTLDLILTLDAGGEGDKLEWFKAVLARHPQIAKNAHELLAEFFEHRLDHMKLDLDALVVFDALDAFNIPWGIVTNGKTEQWDKVRKMGLDKATDCVLVSSDFGHYKPDIRIFQAAAEQIGVEARSILFVGDHALNDIEGSRRAGMQTAWLRRGREWSDVSSETQPDYTLNRLAELMPIIKWEERLEEMSGH